MTISFFSANTYKQQRQASIQDDLNQLYDTRPTLASHYQSHSGDSIFMDGDLPAPYFDLNFSGNVTAVLGKTALLNCRVKNIGNRTVSSSTSLYFLFVELWLLLDIY